jgi:hypothetical protein
MGFFPNINFLLDPLATLAVGHALSLGGNGLDNGVASTLNPIGTNVAMFVPFRIGKTIIAKNMFCLNGSAVAGSIDIGIYTADGTKLVSTGSTAQSGTSAIQTISITNTEFGPGLFYLALAANNAGNRFQCANTINAYPLQVMGVAMVTASFPLPATVTFATATVSKLPIFGLTTRSFV